MKSQRSSPSQGAQAKPVAPKESQLAAPPRRGHTGDGAASVLPRLKEWERSRARDRAGRESDRNRG